MPCPQRRLVFGHLLSGGGYTFRVGSRASRRPSPRRLKPTETMKMASPGRVVTQGRFEHRVAAVVGHLAPVGGGGLDAETEEGEGGGEDDHLAGLEGSEDDDRGEGVDEDVTADDRAGGAAGPGRDDVLAVAEGEDGGADEAGEGGDEDDGEGHHRVEEAGTEGGDDGDGEEDRREGEEDVGDPHQHGVDPAAEVAGDEPMIRPKTAATRTGTVATRRVVRLP